MRFLLKQSSEALSDIAVAVLEKWGDALGRKEIYCFFQKWEAN